MEGYIFGEQAESGVESCCRLGLHSSVVRVLLSM